MSLYNYNKAVIGDTKVYFFVNFKEAQGVAQRRSLRFGSDFSIHHVIGYGYLVKEETSGKYYDAEGHVHGLVIRSARVTEQVV